MFFEFNGLVIRCRNITLHPTGSSRTLGLFSKMPDSSDPTLPDVPNPRPRPKFLQFHAVFGKYWPDTDLIRT